MAEQALLGDYVSLQYGKLPPKDSSPEAVYPIFTGYRISGFSKTYLFPEPEVVVIARGVGGTGDVKISPPFSYITNLSIVLQPTRPVNKWYLRDYLSLANLRQLDSGAAQSMITIESLRKFPITLPTIEVQNKVAEIIARYDDLIETNRRRIALLEEAARLLYREWFVNLRFPGHEQGKMVDGLPAKWRRVKLSEICQQERNQVDPASVASDTPYLSMEHMTSKSICLGAWGAAEKVSSSKIRFQRGDILFGRIRPYFHKVGIAQVDGVTSTDMIVVRAKSKRLQPVVALVMSSDDFVGYAVTTSNGTKMPRADWKVLKNWEIQLPNENILTEFAERLIPIFESLDVLSGQNIALKKSRDELLPKLMSGEIQV